MGVGVGVGVLGVGVETVGFPVGADWLTFKGIVDSTLAYR